MIIWVWNFKRMMQPLMNNGTAFIGEEATIWWHKMIILVIITWIKSVDFQQLLLTSLEKPLFKFRVVSLHGVLICDWKEKRNKKNMSVCSLWQNTTDLHIDKNYGFPNKSGMMIWYHTSHITPPSSPIKNVEITTVKQWVFFSSHEFDQLIQII